MTVLFVLSTIILFLAVDWVYRHILTRKEARAPSAISQATGVSNCSIRTPEGIFFTKSHTWLNLFPSGKVQLGVDDFVGRMFEKPDVRFLQDIGRKVEKGDPLATLSDGQHCLTIYSPISGKVVELNDDLPRHPDYLKTTTFSDGWLCRISPSRLSEMKSFLLGPESRSWMREELERLREFLTGVDPNKEMAPLLLQDGGIPAVGAMSSMNSSVWQRFEREFLFVAKAPIA